MVLRRFLASAGVLALALVPCIGRAQTPPPNLPPPGGFQPIPNFTGTNAGLQFRNAINDRFSGQSPIAPKMAALKFAQLPGEQDGLLLYCTDCQKTIPCTGGGSGAWVFGHGGAWNCMAPGNPDLAGDAVGPGASNQVTATHLSSPLPKTQGGTGNGQGADLSSYNGAVSAIATGASDGITSTNGGTFAGWKSATSTIFQAGANVNELCTGSGMPYSFCTGAQTGSATQVKCDGWTDDASAIGYLITAATTSPGAIIEFPSGICRTKSGVGYTGSIPFTMRGGGAAASVGMNENTRTVFQADSGNSGVMLTLAGAISPLQGMRLENFTLDCNSIAASGFVMGDHGFDYSHLSNVEVKNCTGDGVYNVSGGHLIDAEFDNLISHDNAGRGLLLQGTANNELFVGGKFFYNYQAGGGEQVQVGVGSSRIGPVTFVGTDMEDSPADVGTDIALYDNGGLIVCSGCYFESHGTANSTAVTVAKNTTGDATSLVLLGGFSQGGSTSNYAIAMPGSLSTSPVNVTVIGFHPFNYLCGGSCTSSKTNPSTAAPMSGEFGPDVNFVSLNNDWYPDTLTGLTQRAGSAMTAQSNFGNLWFDSTALRWLANMNGASSLDLVGIGAAGTGGNCAKLASNGIDVADSGAPCVPSIGPLMTASGASSGSVAANSTTGGPFFVPGSLTFSKLAFDVTTSDSNSSDKYDVCIYDSSGTLIANSGAQNLGSTGAVDLSTAQGSQTIGPGTYWIAFTGNAASAAIRMTATEASLNAGATTSGGGCASSATIATSASALQVPAVLLH